MPRLEVCFCTSGTSMTDLEYQFQIRCDGRLSDARRASLLRHDQIPRPGVVHQLRYDGALVRRDGDQCGRPAVEEDANLRASSA